MTPVSHFAAAQAAIAEARAAPLSRKKAMLAALLLDAAVDAAFEKSRETDILAFRAALSAANPALALVLSLAAMTDTGPRLVLEPVTVGPAEYPKLPVEDYMVSLYNDRAVQRVQILLPDGVRRDVHEVLAAAMDELGSLS